MKSTYDEIFNDSQSMRSWDEFYVENYNWALRCIIHHEPNFHKARILLDKIFLGLTLDPIAEVNGDSSFKSKLSIKLAGIIARLNREKRYRRKRQESSSLRLNM